MAPSETRRTLNPRNWREEKISNFSKSVVTYAVPPNFKGRRGSHPVLVKNHQRNTHPKRYRKIQKIITNCKVFRNKKQSQVILLKTAVLKAPISCFDINILSNDFDNFFLCATNNMQDFIRVSKDHHHTLQVFTIYSNGSYVSTE